VTLVDTSVWVQHLRYGSNHLRSLLENGEVLCHPFIVGELACGSMKNRDEVLSLLQALPVALIGENEEVMRFLRERQLHGRGLGWIDIHLLVSASLSQAFLWTNDRALKKAADAQRK
jgi:predicted nucleic acid-binding protein